MLNFKENIRSSALSALHALWTHCYQLDSEEKVAWRENIIKKYIEELQCGREAQCLGYAAALGLNIFMNYLCSFSKTCKMYK